MDCVILKYVKGLIKFDFLVVSLFKADNRLSDRFFCSCFLFDYLIILFFQQDISLMHRIVAFCKLLVGYRLDSISKFRIQISKSCFTLGFEITCSSSWSCMFLVVCPCFSLALICFTVAKCRIIDGELSPTRQQMVCGVPVGSVRLGTSAVSGTEVINDSSCFTSC